MGESDDTSRVMTVEVRVPSKGTADICFVQASDGRQGVTVESLKLDFGGASSVRLLGALRTYHYPEERTHCSLLPGDGSVPCPGKIVLLPNVFVGEVQLVVTLANDGEEEVRVRSEIVTKFLNSSQHNMNKN